MKLLSILLGIAFFVSCGPQWIQDPNASVLVTSQYEDGPEKIITINNGECRPQIDCSKLSESQCAIALYHDADKFIKEGRQLLEKKLFLAANLEFMQAMCRLIESEIRTGRSKVKSFKDYKAVTEFSLDKKVKQKIKYCKRMMRFSKWERGL